MCNQTQIPSVNLQTAVLMQVQEFVNSGQGFSRYDITKALRQKCNDGLLEIPETENINGSPRFDIRKAAVDAIFDQLFQNCLANGLPPLTVAFNPTLGYRIFTADPSAATPIAVPVQSVPASTAPVVSVPAQSVAPTTIPIKLPPTPDPTRMFTAPALSTPTITPIIPDVELRRRVDLYMKNCQRVGKSPTLRQIQSAIKRDGKSTGLSRRECGSLAVTLGYQVA